MQTHSSDFAFKLRLLVPPMLLLAAGFGLVYSLLDWLLVAWSGWLPLDDDLAKYWLPVGAAVVLTSHFIGPRLRLLKFSEKRRVRELYFLVAVAAIAAPAIVAQFYVHAAAGGITPVKDAADIATAAQTKYYAPASICMERERAAAAPAVAPISPRDDQIVVSFYVVIPVCGPSNAHVWIGLRYRSTIERNLPDAEKDRLYADFQRRSAAALAAENPARYRYLERLGHNADRKNFEKALGLAGGDPQTDLVLQAHTEPFEQRTGDLLAWTFAAFGIAMAAWFLLATMARVDHDARALKRQEHEASAMRTVGLHMLLPTPGFYGIPLLLDINILVFAAMVLSGLNIVSFSAEDMLAWGANYGPYLHGLGWLRLISSQFVHAGLMHLLSNMYGLFIVSLFLLPVASNARLIGCYLICGLAGAITSVMVHPEIVSAGASGAIMGLCGILLALVAWRDARVVAGTSPILVNIGIMTVLTVGQGFAVPGIDNAAHLGGLAAGLVLGTLLHFEGARGHAA